MRHENRSNHHSHTKSIWSRAATSIYLHYLQIHNCNLQYIKRNIIIIILILTFTIYCLLISFFKIPIYFNIFYGLKYHRAHFKWHTSLNGNFCHNKPLKQGKSRHNIPFNLWKISQNNTNFEQTRSRILLLSYPRSGNHLTRAIIECLLNVPTYGYQKEKHDVYINKKTTNQTLAIINANINTPFVRKIHTANAIPFELEEYNNIGLIYLIRDPIESITSENKCVPYFWKDYEYQFDKNYLKLARFYNQWKNDNSKLVLFYEDYFNEKSKEYYNLKQLAMWFGKDRISDKQLDFCINNYDEVVRIGLGALQRKSTSNKNLHFYREQYAKSGYRTKWPMLKVSKELYQDLFSSYDNLQSC